MAKEGKAGTARRRRQARGVFERPKGSGVWWARYHDQHGREHRERVGARGLAAEVYRKRKTEIAERRFFPERIRQADVLLAEMVDDVLDRSAVLRAYSEYERAGRYWKAALASRTLREIVPGDVERYKARRIREVSAATVNRELMFLKRLFNLALRDGKAERNPVREVKFFKEDNERVRWLTDEEEACLREELGEGEWPKVSFALNTGFRQANQFGLPWSDVNFETGLVTARGSKSGETYHVPMNDDLRELLRGLESRLKSAWVFPSRNGRSPLNATNYMNRVFAAAVKRAGVANFRWHDLRHTFASRLVMAGVDLSTVRELMGHKTIRMTQRYAHLSPAHKLDAVERLGQRRTGTITGTSAAEEKTDVKKLAVKTTEAPDPEGPSERAGDRGRTGDVQLGKLIDEGPEDYRP
jgi:integrase